MYVDVALALLKKTPKFLKKEQQQEKDKYNHVYN
jgi:hypothetical protein